MKLAFLANTRLDCLFEISQLAQATEGMFENFKKQNIKQLNKAVSPTADNQVSPRVPQLGKKTLQVIGYSDASFDKIADLSSQIGQVFF